MSINADDTPASIKAANPQSPSLRANAQWMLAGNITYGACQWLMMIVVARLGSSETVGLFSLASAITVPIIALIGLDLRTVQATDQSNQYRFEDFFTLRITTLVLSMLAIMAVTFWNGYKPETTLLIFVTGISKCVEAMSFLCHGTLQQHEHLDRMAKSRIARAILSVVVMAIALYVSQSLVIATVALTLVWTVTLIFSDWPAVVQLLHERGESASLWSFRRRPLTILLMAAIPSGILACQSSLESSLPRLCIDGYLGERDLGIFAAISSMTMAGALIINSVHAAVLPRISRCVVQGDGKFVAKILINLSVIGGAVGGLGTLAVYLLGPWVLGTLFGEEYAAHSPLLVVLMFAAGVRYATLPLSTGLRANKQFWLLTILQTVSLLASIPPLMMLVKQHGAMGAAYGSVVMSLLYAALQIPASIKLFRPTQQPVNSVGPQVLPADIRNAA